MSTSNIRLEMEFLATATSPQLSRQDLTISTMMAALFYTRQSPVDRRPTTMRVNRPLTKSAIGLVFFILSKAVALALVILSVILRLKLLLLQVAQPVAIHALLPALTLFTTTWITV